MREVTVSMMRERYARISYVLAVVIMSLFGENMLIVQYRVRSFCIVGVIFIWFIQTTLIFRHHLSVWVLNK